MPTYDEDGLDEDGFNELGFNNAGARRVTACGNQRCQTCEWLAPLVIPGHFCEDLAGQVATAVTLASGEQRAMWQTDSRMWFSFLRDQQSRYTEDREAGLADDSEPEDEDEPEYDGNPDDEGVLSCTVNPCDWLGWRGFDSRYKPGDALLSFEFECEPTRPSSAGRIRAIDAVLVPVNAAYAAEVGHTFRRTRGGIIVCRDGSLSEYGLEFKTVPMTLDEHRRVLRKAFPDGIFGGGAIKAWSMTDCGMHVHQSCPFSNWHVGKSLAFHMQPGNHEFLVGIAGRLANNYCAATTAYGHTLAGKMFREQRHNAPKYLTQRYKHHAERLKRTLETRAFRPSKRIDVILKNLGFVVAARHFVHLASGAGKVTMADPGEKRIRYSLVRSTNYPGLHWQEFLRWLALTPHRKSYIELHQWLLRSPTGSASPDQRVAPFRRFYMNLFNNKPGRGR